MEVISTRYSLHEGRDSQVSEFGQAIGPSRDAEFDSQANHSETRTVAPLRSPAPSQVK